MKKNCLTMICSLLAGISLIQGAVLVDADFSTYSDGTLVGQNGWLQTSTTATNPIQVSSGETVLGTAGGQDVYLAFSSTVSAAAGTSLYTIADLSVTSATATGDYFLHLSNPVGTTSNFYERVYARSSGAGFVFGFVDTSGTGSTITWGTDVLDFSTSYNLVVEWNFVSGATNDTFELYVDGTSYLTHTWTSTGIAEPTDLSAINLRQGSATNSAGVLISSLEVTDVNPIPEPTTGAMLLGSFGTMFWVIRRKRV